MYNRVDLSGDLCAMGVSPDGVLLVHSSMKAIGPVEGGADEVIQAFSAFMAPGLLVLPTHTWDQIEKGNFWYDPTATPSCVGILSNLFMRRPGVFRSLHPTHSVAALGIGAESFVSGEEWTDTPCSREGCYGKLYDMGAQVLFLGCSLKRNTLLHGVEEWNSIPGRITETTALFRIRMPDGSKMDRPMHLHDQTHGDISRNYDKIGPILFERKIARSGRFGDAECVLCDVCRMADCVSEYLRLDPDLFLDDRTVPGFRPI